MRPAPREIKLGLWENTGQFSLLVLVNAFVSSMVGLERTVVPLIPVPFVTIWADRWI